MVNTDREPRQVPVLNPSDQQTANELFDRAVENAHGQMVLLGGSDSAVVTVLKKGKRGSMEILRVSPEGGEVTLRLRKGRKGWQDDGAEGIAGSFFEGSKVEPEEFHPNARTRDRVLREVHDIFIAPSQAPQ